MVTLVSPEVERRTSKGEYSTKSRYVWRTGFAVLRHNVLRLESVGVGILILLTWDRKTKDHRWTSKRRVCPNPFLTCRYRKSDRPAYQIVSARSRSLHCGNNPPLALGTSL